MHKIKCNGQMLYAEEGMLLSDALIQSGQYVEHVCGGRGSCRKCTVIVDDKVVLSCQYRIRSDIKVSLLDNASEQTHMENDDTGKTTPNMCFALDIGSTTLVLALVSLDEKEIVKTISRPNPQRVFGGDVITRIHYCRQHGPEELCRVLRTAINDMIASFGLPMQPKLYIAGNTTMLHLFFGVDCSAMGVAPYTPVFLEGRHATATDLDIIGVHEIYALPSIATFVGADLVAGLNLVQSRKQERYCLLVDLGTNAEVLLFSGEDVICTAAAAGPCFEGANILCGMSATTGAIQAYKNGQIDTIGNTPAKGVCGTGLLDIVASLLEDGTIDETGYMECERFLLTPDVSITQADVRQFQAAKSAVCSAIMTLMRAKNLCPSDIDTLYISGGFSTGINLDNAVRTGLIPQQLRDKCVTIRNSSLLGTVQYACDQEVLSNSIFNADYIDLSTMPLFSELFVENMLFAEIFE